MKRLNIGCGPDVLPGWINADVRVVKGAQLSCSILTLPFREKTMDQILAHDVIEHVQRYEVSPMFREFLRVLKPGGRLFLCTPNLDQIAHAYVQGKIGPERLEALLYGGQTYKENTHLTGFTPSILRRIAADAGFAQVEPWLQKRVVSPHNQCWQCVAPIPAPPTRIAIG